MTDDELDVLVRSTARPVVGLAPSELDPGFLDALLAAREDRALPLLGGPGGNRVLWAVLASAAALLLGFTVAAMPDSGRDRDTAPAEGGVVQRYLLPDPWRVSDLPAPVDVDRLDIGVTGRMWFTAGAQDGDEMAILSWQTQRRHEEDREQAVAFTGGEGEDVTVEGWPYEVYVRTAEPQTFDGGPTVGPSPAVAAAAVWVEGATSYLLYAQYVDEDGMVDLLASLEPVSEEAWVEALPGGRRPPADGVAADSSTVDDEDATVAAVLAGVPLPPEVDLEEAYRVEGSWERGPLAGQALRGVGCGWLQEWRRATAAGESARAQEALQGMQDLAGEPVVQEIASSSTVSEQVARYADLMGQEGTDPEAVLRSARGDLCPLPTPE